MQPLNEDALLDLPEKKIWAVADGRGTQTAGSLASQSLIRSLQALHRDQDGPFSEQILKDSLDAAYDKLYQYAQSSRLDDIGADIAVLAELNDTLVFGASGSCRIYRCAGNQLQPLTLDSASHNLTATRSESGVPRESCVRWSRCAARPGDTFLLSTAGFYLQMSEADLLDVLSSKTTARTMAHQLLETCLEKGAPENLTVLVVRIEE